MATKHSQASYKNSLPSSTILYEDKTLQQKLIKAGWKIEPVNNSNGTQEFGIAWRKRRQDLAQKSLEFTPILADSGDKTAGQRWGSNVPFGPKGIRSTPTPGDTVDEAAAHEVIENLSTLKAVRSGKPTLVFAVDTEFVTSENREILTWQVAFVMPEDANVLVESVFFSANREKRLGVGRMLSYLICRFSLADLFEFTDCPASGFAYSDARRWTVPLFDTRGKHWGCYQKGSSNWKTFDNFKDAYNACKDPDFLAEYDASAQPWSLKMSRNRYSAKHERLSLAGYERDYSEFFNDKNKIPVTVLFHYAPADLTSFTIEDYEKDVMRRVSSVQKGLVTITPWRMMPKSPSGFRFYPLSVSVRDTMAHAPAKMKSLEKLGETVGINKL